MSKRRTRREKIHTKTQWENFRSEKETPSALNSIPVSFYVPEMTLSLSELRKDLTKSLSLTILALILQFSLAAYLNRGGWQIINSMLQKLFSGTT